MSLLRILIGQYFANKVEEKIVDTSSHEVVHFVKENSKVITTGAIASLLFLIMLPMTIFSSLFAFSVWGATQTSPFWSIFYLGTGITLVPLLVAIVMIRKGREKTQSAKREVKEKIIEASAFSPIIEELKQERTRFQLEQNQVHVSEPMPQFH